MLKSSECARLVARGICACPNRRCLTYCSMARGGDRAPVAIKERSEEWRVATRVRKPTDLARLSAQSFDAGKCCSLLDTKRTQDLDE